MLRDDAGGHDFGLNDYQNRGPHFNDQKEVTTTTKNDFEVASNVFVANTVFNIPQRTHEALGQLSAALKLYPGRPLADRQEKALMELYGRIHACFPSHLVWLVISNGGKVPDTKIVRHCGLWRSLEKNAVELPEGERTSEYILEDDGEIQFFGGICLRYPRFQEVTRLISLHSSAHVVLSDNEHSVRELLSSGWFYDSRKFPTSILRQVERASMFFLAPLGEFDDMEGGAVAIAKPPLIASCFSLGSEPVS